MMKRLITFFIVTFFVCSTIRANAEYNVILEKGDSNNQIIELPYGNISFRLIEYGSYYRASVSIENTTPSQAILLFKNAQGEKVLKKNKPKIEFEKKYPGSKGNRSVFGCKELRNFVASITPQDKLELFSFDIHPTSITKLVLPLYLAKYDPKKLVKKGPYNINYKILSEEILYFNIELKGWSENDPDYVSTKTAVEEYIRSVNIATFCKNKNHIPSLVTQLKPYQEKKDSLVNVINTTLKNHSDWLSPDKPHIKYSELLSQLNHIDLYEHTYDCGKHKTPPRKHRCKYCSLNAQQIYHQLDDIYQQLRTGKITKEAAVKKAKVLDICYKQCMTRRKEPEYTEKVSRFYNRIVNY